MGNCWGTTIWLPTTTLKTGPRGMMSNAIKIWVCLPHHPLVLRWNVIAHNPTNDIRAKVMNSSHGSVIVREGLLGDHNLTPYNHSKNRSAWCNVECHKIFECVFLITNWFWSGMTQLTIWQIVSEPKSWVRVTGVLLWERDCWGTTIWLSTITLKIGLWVRQVFNSTYMRGRLI